MCNNRLNIYKISDKYIEYISEIDNHIAYNKEKYRPYIGIVLEINNFLYFAPMFSPKQQHLKYKENLSFFKMYGDINRKDYLGIIRFSNMIPVPVSEVSLINIQEKGKKYNYLLDKQYDYINKNENRIVIRDKAEKIHNIIMKNKKGKITAFYKNICCNFKILEEKCLEYKK